MDAQLLFNIVLGCASGLAGWLFKVLYDQLKDCQEEINDLEDKVESDHRLMQEKINNLALSLPEKYVSKEDFKMFADRLNDRFDRLEEKIDNLKK